MDVLGFLWLGIRDYIIITTWHWYKALRHRRPTATFIFEIVVLLLVIGLIGIASAPFITGR